MVGDRKSLVSIGVPVYNGEDFLREALDSLLTQTYENFEVLISDNASTDNTEQICREYVEKDRRVHYVRNAENIGPARNYNRVFELAKGEYFKWAAHDDICAPTFLEKCVAVLDRDPEIVLSHTQVQMIDDRGDPVNEGNKLYIPTANATMKTDSAKPQERFGDIICVPHPCYPIFGLMRTEVLRKMPLIGSYSGGDRVLLARLSLLGKFGEISEALFFPRRHAKQSLEIALSRQSSRLYVQWFDPTTKGKATLPRFRLFQEYLDAIARANLTRQERLGCYVQMLRWLKWRWKGMLIKDPAVATIQVLQNTIKSAIAPFSKGKVSKVKQQ